VISKEEMKEGDEGEETTIDGRKTHAYLDLYTASRLLQHDLLEAFDAIEGDGDKFGCGRRIGLGIMVFVCASKNAPVYLGRRNVHFRGTGVVWCRVAICSDSGCGVSPDDRPAIPIAESRRQPRAQHIRNPYPAN